MMTRGRVGVWVLAAIGTIVACASETETIVVVADGGSGTSNADASAGSAGAGATGGGSTGGSGGTGATGGSSGAGGSAAGGTGGGTGGSAGAGGSTGGSGGGGGSGGSGATGGTGGAGGCSTATSCKPNEICTEVCGMCGTRSRLCDSNGAWLPWGDCSGESGVCQTGQQKSEKCGKCGTRTYYCSNTCSWLPGPCDGEGLCYEGAIQTTTASCTNGEVRAQFCDATCNWGQFSQCSSKYTWQAMATSPLDGRREFGAVWTGTELFILGGYGTGGTSTYKNDGAKYNPATNTWSPIAQLPSQRFRIDPVYTGTKIIYWGGNSTSTGTYANDGAIYDIATNAWTPIPSTGAPSGRYGHAAVWDQVAQKLIVWGGYGPSYNADGAIFDPVAGTWTPLPAAPIDARRQFAFGWDPVRRWLYVWGGYGNYVSSSYYRDDGAIYDASTNNWTKLPAAPTGVRSRYGMPGAVAGDRFVVFGGHSSPSPYYLNDGLVYDAAAGSWTAITTSPLDGRYYHMAATSGSKVFYFGGQGTTPTYKQDGAVLDAASLTWAGAPVATIDPRSYPGGAWTPNGIVVWGGYGSGGSSTYKNDGAIYQP